MPHLVSQQSCADYPRAFFLFWFPFRYKKPQEVLLDTWLFWCQEVRQSFWLLVETVPVVETILLLCQGQC